MPDAKDTDMNERPAPNRFTAEWGPWTQKMIPQQQRDEARGMLCVGGVPSTTQPGPSESSEEVTIGLDL